MKAKKIGYWVSTGIVALILLSGGVMQVTLQPQNVEGFRQLGYPVYFMVLLGVWKLLGGIALLAPRFPRVKEWAYAGAFIDFSGAAVTCAACGGGGGHVIAPLVCIAILFASWALRPESRTLGTLLPATA
jgi:uncharacterized membrane protein YphA (DoxX/SURF4 family)